MTTIRTSTPLPAQEAAEIEKKLDEARRQAPGQVSGGAYRLIHDSNAPTLEEYAKVGKEIMHPERDQSICYAIYLAAKAAGVPESVAYAAYLVCLAS
jgi:hypothetical protein